MAEKLKVLILNGSPRTEGNTTIAIHEMEHVFEENGVEYETIQVGKMDIRGCAACGTCYKNGKCMFDDIVNELAPKFEAADGMVIASPVFYASANATLIACLDRLFYSTKFDKTMKVGASVVCARRGGCSATFDELNKYFTISDMPIASGQYWNCIHGRIIEGEVCPDHIHLLLSIPPKMSVSGFMGYLKGKSSLMIFQRFGNMKFAYRNREFWCKG